MKLSKHYHCFGCQANGDAISFVARYFDLRHVEAVKMLADDFGISYDDKTYTPSGARPNPKISAELEAKKKELQCYRTLCNYLHTLQKWQVDYVPATSNEEYPPLYIETLQKISYVEYILDEVFLNGSVEDKTDFVRANGNKIAELENRIQRLDPEEEKLSDLSIAI